MGFPGVSDRKESTRNVGDWGLIPVLGRSPGGGHGNPLQYSCLENPHGQRSLAGYHRSGRKESDTTRRLSTHKNDGLGGSAEQIPPVMLLLRKSLRLKAEVDAVEEEKNPVLPSPLCLNACNILTVTSGNITTLS